MGRRFADDYGQILQGLEQRLGPEQYELVPPRLPDAHAVRSMTGLRWGILPLQGDGAGPAGLEWLAERAGRLADLSGDAAIGAQLRALRDDIERLRRDGAPRMLGDAATRNVLALAREHMHRMAESLAETVFREPRRAFAEGLDHLREALESGSVIRQGTLEIARRVCRQLRNFEFVADERLLASLGRMEQSLEGLSPEALEDGRVSRRLTAAISGAVRQASDEVAAREAMRRFRSIRVDPRRLRPTG